MTLSSQSNDPFSHYTQGYVGRFAPSPTGPLHFGSLIAALASYLDARANNGKWLVRMEDLDPPREPPGAAKLIEAQLLQCGFEWDEEILYQSSRLDAYADALKIVENLGLSFACNCTRQRLQSIGSVYDGHCRKLGLAKSFQNNAENQQLAQRIKVAGGNYTFTDLIQGPYAQNLELEVGDFIIRRKDRLFAYQFAVVIDDAYQNISRVVRGFDLLDSTARQLHIQCILGLPRPEYAHFPTASDEAGDKLSKQQFAAAIDASKAAKYLIAASRFLGLEPTVALKNEPPAKILQWAIEHWDIHNVPKLATIKGTWT